MSCAVLPVIAMSPSVLSVIEDQQLTLPCVLLAGNPLPERQWLHDYGLVRKRERMFTFLKTSLVKTKNVLLKPIEPATCQVTSDQYVTVRRDGSLHIERVRLDDAGDYTCLAENAVGATNHTTTVNVYGSVHKDIQIQLPTSMYVHKHLEELSCLDLLCKLYCKQHNHENT